MVLKQTVPRSLAGQPAFWLVLACGASVRFFGLFRHTTMPDEAFTFFISSHSLQGIITLLRVGDFHPPLVYVIGHALFAWTSRAYLFRIVTAFFGLGGVAASYALAQRIVGPWAPFAALLVALNPVLAFYDGFFRMYAMLWSLAMLSWACLLWALDEQHRAERWICYAAVVVALLYTQYLAFFTLAAQVCYVLFARRRAFGFWLASATALALFLPWVPILITQYPLGGKAFNVLAGHLGELSQAPTVLLMDGVPLSFETSLVTVTVLNAIVAGGLIIAWYERRLLLLALFAPMIFQLAYSLASGKLLFGERYLLQAVPPLVFACVILAQWLARIRLRPLGFAVMASLLVLMLGGTIDKHLLAPYQPIDWSEYGHFLDAHIAPGDAVVFDGSMSYYALVGTKATQARPLMLVSSSSDAERYAAQASTLSRVWYIGYQSDFPDPDRRVFKALLRSHPRQMSWRSTQAAYGDVVDTTLFLPKGSRGP